MERSFFPAFLLSVLLFSFLVSLPSALAARNNNNNDDEDEQDPMEVDFFSMAAPTELPSKLQSSWFSESEESPAVKSMIKRFILPKKEGKHKFNFKIDQDVTNLHPHPRHLSFEITTDETI